MNLLSDANKQMRCGKYNIALDKYKEIIDTFPCFEALIEANISISIKKLSQQQAHGTDELTKRGSYEPKLYEVFMIMPEDLNLEAVIQAQLIASEIAKYGVKCTFVVPDNAINDFDYYPWLKSSQILRPISYEKFIKKLPTLIKFSKHYRKLVHFWDKNSGTSILLKKIVGINSSTPIVVNYTPANINHINGLLFEFSLSPMVDDRLFYPRPKNLNLKNRLGVRSDQRLIVCIGSIGSPHNEKHIACIASYLEKIGQQNKFIILSPKIDKCGQKQYSLGGSVPPTLSINRVQLPEILSAADVIYWPAARTYSKNFGFPAALSECFAMGKPIVLSNKVFPKLLSHKLNAWLLDKQEPDEVFNAFKSITEDSLLEKKLSTNSVVFFRNHMQKPNRLDVLNFYKSLLSSKQ